VKLNVKSCFNALFTANSGRRSFHVISDLPFPCVMLPVGLWHVLGNTFLCPYDLFRPISSLKLGEDHAEVCFRDLAGERSLCLF
jgi:hypothetical protein